MNQSFQTVRSMANCLAIFWHCRPGLQPVAVGTGLNSRSPTVKLFAITTNPAASFNLRGGFQALRSLSSFRSLLKHLQEPGSIFPVLFSPTPTLSLIAIHARTKAWSRKHDAQRNSASGA